MNILYICTHNRCRSILSEAITNHLAPNYLAQGRVQAFSAGSQPSGHVHPLSLKYLNEKGISTDGLNSKSWDEFTGQNIDVVITVCDSAAAEPCPHWLKHNTTQFHWSLPDPSKLTGTENEIRDAFYAVMHTIDQRVKKLLDADLCSMKPAERLRVLTKLAGEM